MSLPPSSEQPSIEGGRGDLFSNAQGESAPQGNRLAMLIPEGRPEKKRNHGSRRGWLLWLVPPLALLTWALAGMRLQCGNRYLQTHWTQSFPMRRNSEFEFWILHLGDRITTYEFRYGRIAFQVEFGERP